MKVVHVLRKPCSEPTVAANVLRHGTGAMNIDGCRVGTTVETWPKSRSYPFGGEVTYGSKNAPTELTQEAPAGRWPANLVLQHLPTCEQAACAHGCPVVALDAQSGITKSNASGYNFSGSVNDNPTRVTHNIKSGVHFGDTGGASRYFKQVGRKQVGG